MYRCLNSLPALMLAVAGLSFSSSFGAHLVVGGAGLDDINLKKLEAAVEVDVAWDKSWKNDINCDGVWIFAKYRVAGGPWKHVNMKRDSGCEFDDRDHAPKGFTVGSGAGARDCGIWVPDTRKGFFIFKARGTGDVNLEDVSFAWDLTGVDAGVVKQDGVEVKVFGLEMVYIPESKHYVGDPKGPSGPDNCLYTFPDNGAYLISSESAIKVEDKPGSLYCDQDNPRSRDEASFVIPDGFPKGFRSLWYMKYELSSRQYVDFLNSLARVQQAARVESDISGDVVTNYYVMTATPEEHMGQSIVCARKGNGTKDPLTFYTYAPARACNFIGWSDIEAYADWAGLRPLTELEYEKACRGSADAVASEYAWGTPDLGRVDTFDGAEGSGYEEKVPKTGVVNCCFGGGIAPFAIAAGQTVPDNPGFEGPVSIGLFENTQHEGISKRVNDGASCYGVMELCGNLWERCVTIGNKEGRRFTGIHGDGELGADGYADVRDWPGREGAGAGNRGGVWSSPSGKFLVFALRFAANNPRDPRGKNSGCRVGF